MAWNPGQLVRWGLGRLAAKEIVRGYNIKVAELPAALVHSYRLRGFYVTDASASTFNATVGVSGKTVSGGGSYTVPVFSDGTDWRVG